KRHQSIVARVAASLGRDKLDGTHDIGVSQLQHRGGGLLDGKFEALGQWLEDTARRRAGELHPAAQKSARPDGAHREMGVSDGWLLAALAVTGRARIGACALWADA